MNGLKQILFSSFFELYYVLMMQRFSFCLVVILFLCNSTKRIHEMHNALSNDTSHYEHAWSFSNILRTSFQVPFVIAVFSNQHYTVHINKTQEISETLHTSFWSLNAEVGQRITMCTLVQCSSSKVQLLKKFPMFHGT